MKVPEVKEFYTVKEVSELIGVSEQTIRNVYVKEGKLRATKKLGSNRLGFVIKASDFEEFKKNYLSF